MHSAVINHVNMLGCAKWFLNEGVYALLGEYLLLVSKSEFQMGDIFTLTKQLSETVLENYGKC
jgi:hypothetical protein